ncbi:MAG: hypothetical protein ACJARE_003422 [Paracoccaceae bacterium]|jgi:hypothetical protein
MGKPTWRPWPIRLPQRCARHFGPAQITGRQSPIGHRLIQQGCHGRAEKQQHLSVAIVQFWCKRPWKISVMRQPKIATHRAVYKQNNLQISDVIIYKIYNKSSKFPFSHIF